MSMARFLALLLLGGLLSGCSVQFTDLTPYTSSQPQQAVYSAPVIGRNLCLSSEPGVPVTTRPGNNEAFGYTRDIVAFAGLQNGQHIAIKYYNGALGWIDGMKVRPYRGPRPGSTCIIPGVDLQQRPIFILR